MKETSKIILHRAIGFIIFLILLGVANLLTKYVNITFYPEIVNFFNSNILFLLFLSLLGTLSEIFWNLKFPFNLIAPVFSAVLSKFIVDFIQMMWNLLQQFTVIKIEIPFEIISTGVFFIVLIVGYITIFLRKDKKEIKNKLNKEYPDWKKVEKEFRLFFYNLGRALNSMFKKKK